MSAERTQIQWLIAKPAPAAPSPASSPLSKFFLTGRLSQTKIEENIRE